MSRSLWIALVVSWGAATGWGLWKALEYESAVAVVKTPPCQWPGNCAIARDAQRSTLLVFVHPKCPCTRATIRELERLLARHRGRVAVRIIVLKPVGAPTGFEQTNLLAHLGPFPDLQIVVDEGGMYHRQFQASTSGECFLYDVQSQLVFHGGLTPYRGHEGPSAGQSAIVALLRNQTALHDSSPVFGCPLESLAEDRKVSP
jgi:hypothetical protein